MQRDLLEDEQQDDWIKFNKEVKQHLETEVAIHQADSVTETGWEPAIEKTAQLTPDGKLKGTYILTVRKADGTILSDIPAATDWVEANFNHEVLATAQKAFMESLTRREVINIDGVPKKSIKCGYVNVEDEDIKVKIDKDVITALHYKPPKKIGSGDLYKKREVSNQGVKSLEYATDDNGNCIKLDKSEKEERILPEKWMGYCSETRHLHTLTTEFVKKIFTEGFLKQVKKWVYREKYLLYMCLQEVIGNMRTTLVLMNMLLF